LAVPTVNTGALPGETLWKTALIRSGWRARKLLGVDWMFRRKAGITDFMKRWK
jgi:hypothetical protein